MADSTEPCGSWRTTRILEGLHAEEVWCTRADGPCPFVGTIPARHTDNRRCAMEPGTVLRVQWAESAIDEALVAWQHYCAGNGDAPPRVSQDAAVTLDALRVCAGEA